jgi:hypothetical protein
MSAYLTVDEVGMFTQSRQRFDATVGWLTSSRAGDVSHAVLEARLQVAGRELLRQLLQDHLDLRAVREERVPAVVGEDGVARAYAEPGHQRLLCTVFGEVTVARIGYRAKGVDSRFPGDAVLNLPTGLHSHGLRRVAAVEAARGSFDQAMAAIERSCGVAVGKRQVEALAGDTARDVDAFYRARSGLRCPVADVLVLTADAKGIVMRPDALRETTRKAAAGSTRKLTTRLSRGEKTGRKRMAQVVAVYHVTPVPRTPADVIGVPGKTREQRSAGPRAVGKWLHASITDDATTVIGAMFDEASRRDPAGTRTWIALVDGNAHQIEAIRGQARARDRPVTILIDIVHVLEYVWRAAWCFYPEGDPAVEVWVAQQALDILDGHANRIAGRIQRKITQQNLEPGRRVGADACVTYLLNKARYLRYRRALTAGWPIATGIIEAACRYLIKDRLDITGARWGLSGAEAILKLRATASNGDFDDYWTFHLAQEHQRVHHSRYTPAATIT